MPTMIASLMAAGLLLSIAAALAALLTRAAPDPADTHFTQILATTGQGAVGLALLLLAHYGYHPAPILRDAVYAAMAAAFAALATRLPQRTAPSS